VYRATASDDRLRVLVVTNVRQPILEAYLSPLASLDEVGEIVIVRDRADVALGGKIRVATPAPWWPHTTLTKLVSRPFLLQREAARHRPDLLMTLHWFPDGPGVVRLARRLGVPVVVNIIGGCAELIDGGRRIALTCLPRRLKGRAQEYQRARLDRVAVITCTGSATCRWLRGAGVVRPALTVLHAGIGDEWFRDGDATRDIDVAYVGRVDPDKRIDRLLQVLAALGRRRPGIRAIVIGMSETDLRAKRIGDLGGARAALGERLVFLERVDRVSDVLRRAKILLLTSDTEGRPLAALEAMACGVVPVVTDVGDLSEALDQGRAGIAVPLGVGGAGVVAALTEAAGALLEDESRRQTLAARGRAYVRHEHDLRRTREEWQAVTRQALASGAARCASS
jgi:glycosyltransferase involved in cell wall biosynthesis